MPTDELPERLKVRLSEHFAYRRAMPETKPHATAAEKALNRVRRELPHHLTDPLGALQDTPNLLKAREYLTADKRFLVLLGPVGRGKSVAGAAACWGLLSRELADPVATQAELLCFIHSPEFGRLSSHEKNDKEWFAKLKGCRVLFLDDMGTEHLTEYGMGLLNELLEARCGRGRTVLTSNLVWDAFRKRYGERLADRIAGDGVVFADAGPSLRRRVV